MLDEAGRLSVATDGTRFFVRPDTGLFAGPVVTTGREIVEAWASQDGRTQKELAAAALYLGGATC
jgi:hypothetical protein